MGSKLLPQPLVVIPRNPTYSPPLQVKLGFRHGSSFSASRVSASRFFDSTFGSNVNAIVTAFSRHSLVARAEPESEGGVGEVAQETETATENVGDVEEEVKEEEVEAEVKELRKPRVKLGDVMGILNKRAVEASENERPIPDIRTGDIIEIKLEVPENRRRMSIYKGIVMSRQNAGIHTTIRVRRIIAGIGVEIVFPLYSPNIKEIKVVKHRKVRRARLYYLRDKLPKLSTFK